MIKACYWSLSWARRIHCVLCPLWRAALIFTILWLGLPNDFCSGCQWNLIIWFLARPNPLFRGQAVWGLWWTNWHDNWCFLPPPTYCCFFIVNPLALPIYVQFLAMRLHGSSVVTVCPNVSVLLLTVVRIHNAVWVRTLHNLVHGWECFGRAV
jgi:hypothetical protein